jgi:hypothetical protein
MDCATLLNYLSDYIDQNLEAELVQAARQHLATCQNCSVVLDSTQRTILISRASLGGPLLRTERRDQLFSQLEAAMKKAM